MTFLKVFSALSKLFNWVYYCPFHRLGHVEKRWDENLHSWAFNQRGGIFDPQGHGRIDGNYFDAWCPSVRCKNKNALQRSRQGPENKIQATKDTICKNNNHLLAGVCWLTLKSPDFFQSGRWGGEGDGRVSEHCTAVPLDEYSNAHE